MVKLMYSETFKRQIRQDDLPELGLATWPLLKEAISAGRTQESLDLVDYLYPEGKGLHDLYCDWSYAMLDYIARNLGEEEVYKVLRFSLQVLQKTVYANLGNLTMRERIQFYAEFLRSHRGGPGEIGNFDLTEDDKKVFVSFDPCGSGGRLRQTGEIDGTPPRNGPLVNLGNTSKPYPWSWSKAGVPYYCAHCCVWGEIMPAEAVGYPVRVAELPDDPYEPCTWAFYKNPDDIPEEYFHRIGMKKDPSKFVRPDPKTVHYSQTFQGA